MNRDKAKVIEFFKRVEPSVASILAEINLEDWFGKVERDRSKYFEDLCRTIVGQQLAGKAAEAIYKRFSALFDDLVTPENILAKEEQLIRDSGLSWAKVRSVKDLSHRVSEGSLILENLEKLTDEELIVELSKVKGIGRWTAEMFLMFRLGHEDVFSFGDLGLKNGLKKYLQKTDLGLEEMKLVTDKWKPYRTYGAIAMWHLLDNK